MGATEHNHIFQSKTPRPPGECYSCDRIHARSAEDRIFTLEDLILYTEELYETGSAEQALRHLQAFIRSEKLREKHKQ